MHVCVCLHVRFIASGLGHTHVPYEWREVFIISHGDYHVPLLHLVDEGDSQEVGLDGTNVREAGQDMHLSLRV